MGISGEHIKKMVKSNQFEMDDGELNLLGFRMAMLPVYTWTTLMEQIYQKQGEEELFEMLFETGKAHGQYAIDEIGREHDIPRKQFLNQALYTADILGLGQFELEKLNLNEGKIVYRVDNSPFKDAFEDSDILSDIDGGVDDLILGMAHAVSKEVLAGEVEAEETLCTFQGDSHCRFVVERKNDG